MVMYGDSHAGMWFDALNVIAKEAHWRLVDLWKGGCPVDSLTYRVPPGSGKPGTPWVACEQWQRWALGRINSLNPNLLVLTQELRVNQDAKPFTFQQWGQGLTTTFHRIHIPRSRVVVLGNIPFLPDNPPECLARHSSNIQACSGPLDTYVIAIQPSRGGSSAFRRRSLHQRGAVVLLHRLHRSRWTLRGLF